MAILGTVYSYPNNPRVAKAQIAAAYYGHEIRYADNFDLKTAKTDAEWMRKFPLGKVPAFEAADGTCITESSAIACYAAAYGMDGKLTGTTVGEAAKIQQWLLFADNELSTNFSEIVYPIMGFRAYDAERSKSADEKVKRAFGVLETVLKEQPFLVNDHVTLADICVSTALVWPLKTVVDKAFREQYPAVTKWLATLFALPEFKKVLGEVEYVDVALKPKECQA